MEPLELDQIQCGFSGVSEAASGSHGVHAPKGLFRPGLGELGLMSQRKGSPKSGGEGFRL